MHTCNEKCDELQALIDADLELHQNCVPKALAWFICTVVFQLGILADQFIDLLYKHYHH